MSQATVRGRHLTVGDVRIHYIEHVSDGPPLVLVPGITSPAITWQFVGDALADFAHVYTLDNRGRGLSSGGSDLGYMLDDYVADTAGVIEALGLERPTVLGHSMGGRIVVALAAARPDLVGRLIVVDPPVGGPGRRPYPIPLDWYLEGLDKAARGVKSERDSPLLSRWTDEQLALRDEWLPSCDPTAIAESRRSFEEEEIHSRLPRIECPVLLIYAQNGHTVTDDDAHEIMGAVSDCTMIRIDDVGHMIPWDDLDGFVSAVRSAVV